MHTKLLGIALLLAAAIAATSAASAQAKVKSLEVSVASHAVTPHQQVQGYFAEAFLLESTHGEEIAVCEEPEDLGYLTLNDAKADVFEALPEQSSEEDSCYLTSEPDLGESGSFMVTKVTLGANGKASGNVQLDFSKGPSPYQHCVYEGSRLKGTNTVSGTLEVEFGGKLKGKGCHLKTVKLVPTFAVPFMLSGGGYPELQVKII